MNIGAFLRRNAVGIVLLGSFSGCTSVLLSSVYQHAALSARRSTCQSNLHAIMLACQQYSADYDGRYPPLSDGASQGWSLLIQRSGQPLSFSCLAGYKSSYSPSSDYFFNAQLATRRSSSIQDPIYTVAFGDGIDNGPTNSHFWEFPNDWNNDASITRRHGRNANYAFADGHVRSVLSDDLHEWMNGETKEQEVRYKFSPDQPATRTKHHSQNPPPQK